MSLGPRTHPRYKSESVGRFYTSSGSRTHPRYKRESVGRYYLYSTQTDPPSLQTRAGGPYLHAQTPPSLQTRVGGVFPTHMAHPRCKRESVGRFHWAEGLVKSRGAQTMRRLGPGMFFFSIQFFTNIYVYQALLTQQVAPRTPPSLETRVGGVLCCIIHAK